MSEGVLGQVPSGCDAWRHQDAVCRGGNAQGQKRTLWRRAPTKSGTDTRRSLDVSWASLLVPVAWPVLHRGDMAANATVTSTPQAPRVNRRVRRKSARRSGPAVRVVENALQAVVEVKAPKANNPLYRAFRALRDLGVQIVHAEVSAVSDVMIQRFHLVECDGRSLEPRRLSEVLAALSHARPLTLSTV